MQILHPALALALAAALPAASAQELSLPYEKHVLDNGLEVVIHEDHSDPVVAVFVYYHVGSAREEPGRSGFAHLFEHLMFQGSENVGDDEHFKHVQEAGGTLNGSTTGDRTNYFEILPSNQLELALWLEADRMGFLLPAITQENLDNQREVVKNERRQSYENRPYGLVPETVARNLYPEGHPYSWTTIGSMEDLSAASLEDVTSFFRRWYGPNNATIAIGGDVDPERALELAERYFGSIPRGPEVADPEPRPAGLERERRVVIEDEVQLPQITTTWPAVPMGHPDEAALDLLASVLSANKSAVLDKALTVDQELASMVSARHDADELAGVFTVTLRPQRGVHLDRLEQELHRLLGGLAEDGVEPERLQRMKNVYEARVIRGLETVAARTATLAQGNLFHDDPDHVTTELEQLMGVTVADVERVLERYLVGRPSVVVSVVPRGEPELAASGRPAGQVAAEEIDRSTKPAAGPPPDFEAPPVWHATLDNGVAVVGTRFDELPLTRFSLSVPAGRLRETPERLGLASLTAEMLEEGTKRLTGTELQDAFDALGATLNVSSDDYEITLAVSTLDKYLPEVVALVGEVLLEPRFATEDFERIRRERLTALEVRGDDIGAVARDVWQAVMYGPDTVAGMPEVGTEESVSGLAVEDVRTFWETHAKPRGARLSFVGTLDAEGVSGLFSSLTERWRGGGEPVARAATFQEPEPRFPERTTIYLVDKPAAEQSHIRAGHPGVSSLHPRAYDLYLLNYPLGGSFTSRINLNLREDKGYTYGARSGFGEGLHTAPFTAASAVRTDVTAPSVVEFLKELETIHEGGVTEDEVTFTREALTQAMTRQFESTWALLGFLEEISLYERPDDYPARRLERVRTITKEELDALAREFLHPDRLAVVVVGDAEVVRQELEDLGLGEVIELDRHGRPVSG